MTKVPCQYVHFVSLWEIKMNTSKLRGINLNPFQFSATSNQLYYFGLVLTRYVSGKAHLLRGKRFANGSGSCTIPRWQSCKFTVRCCICQIVKLEHRHIDLIHCVSPDGKKTMIPQASSDCINLHWCIGNNKAVTYFLWGWCVIQR